MMIYTNCEYSLPLKEQQNIEFAYYNILYRRLKWFYALIFYLL